MDGRNSTGRKISLLNDSSDHISLAAKSAALCHTYSHSSHSSAHSRSPLSRTPSLSPQTPQLVRGTSSADSRTPSPLTPPSYTFGASSHSTSRTSPHSRYFLPDHHHHHHHHHRFAKMDDPNASLYPPIPDAASLSSAYPLPAQMAMPQILPPQDMQPVLRRSSTSPSSEPSRVSTVSAASAGKVAPKKNQYPCPMAKQIGCTDFFTTSGHAARHAKKHTGKKDAFCPECNKAFTRKDNMEQHRRTHQNGRGASRSSTSDDSKVKKATKQATKKNSLKAESQQLEAAVEQHLAEQQLADQAQAAQSQHTADIIQAQLAQAIQLPPVDHSLLLPAVGPYFLSTGMDSGPVPALPMAISDLTARPPLLRSTFTDNLGYIAPAAPMIDPESLHYSYPSPGLSNGLNSLALAASETQRLNEKPSRSARSPSSETSCSDVTL